MLPYLTGEVKESPRQFFFYFSDDGDVMAIRFEDWKAMLMEQRAKSMDCWAEPFVHLRVPHIFNLRRDPFERAYENSNTYWDWMISHAYLIYADAGDRGGADRGVRQVPAAPEAGLVQPGRGDAAVGGQRRAVTVTKLR